MAADPLERYRSMRDFTRTTEPSGAAAAGGGEEVRFVVQKHAARALHYDVRLEVDGVLASWAVPKGPSYDPAVRRLAVHVEDHPLDYRTFEGTIAGGEYGGGAVIVWDEGTYRNDSERDGTGLDLRAAIDKGHVQVTLAGTKLRGGWHLVRTAGRGGGGSGRDNWLMIKRRDDTADPAVDIEAAEPRSVRSGRTVEEVAAGSDTAAGWTRPAEPVGVGLGEAAGLVASGRWSAARWPSGERLVAVREPRRLELWSGEGAACTDRHPAVAAAVAALPVEAVTLDLVAGAAPGGAIAHVLDLLHLLGRSTTALPTDERLALLERLVGPAADLAAAERPATRDLLADARRRGWERLLLRRRTAPYQGGPTPDWRVLDLAA